MYYRTTEVCTSSSHNKVLSRRTVPVDAPHLQNNTCFTHILTVELRNNLERPSTSRLYHYCIFLCAGNLKLCSWQSTVTSHLLMPMAVSHSSHCLHRIWYYWPWTSFWKVCFHWSGDTLRPQPYPPPWLRYFCLPFYFILLLISFSSGFEVKLKMLSILCCCQSTLPLFFL